MATDKERDNNFNWTKQTGGLQSFGNDDLVCKDCLHRTVEVLTCKKYKVRKPPQVIYGKACVDYDKEGKS